MPQSWEGEERNHSEGNVTTNHFQLDTELFKELPVVTEPEGLLSSPEKPPLNYIPNHLNGNYSVRLNCSRMLRCVFRFLFKCI